MEDRINSPIVLVDTDILIDVGRKIGPTVIFLQAIEQQAILKISAVTQMELIVGCRNKTELSSLDSFLKRFGIVPLDETITKKAVSILHKYRLSHGLLIPDALIAATAITIASTLLTKNVKDYRFIEGLEMRPSESHQVKPS